MHTFVLDDTFSIPDRGNVVTIGSFDGIHIAHQKVIRSVVRLSRKRAGTGIVVTFTPHPLQVIRPNKAPKCLTGDFEKQKLISSLGVDYLLFLKFDDALAALEPREFIKNIIVKKLHAETIVVGYDHGFGQQRAGNVDFLTKLGQKCGFTVNVIEPKLIGGAIISSTSVRNSIYQNDWKRVLQMLRRYYSFTGKVVYGVQRGNCLDFPTANIEIDNSTKLIPTDGVYAVWVKWKNSIFRGAMNIGNNPTFGNNDRTIEIFILDFSQNIYDQTLEVFVVEKLRSEITFPDTESLKEQMIQDVNQVKSILQKRTFTFKTPFFSFENDILNVNYEKIYVKN